MATTKQKTLLLLDMHGLIHRAYHALPKFRSPKGEPTGALYGLSTMLLRAIRELQPDYIVAAYDLPGPTFRHEVYKKYKARRVEVDDELKEQLGRSHDITKAFGIPELSLSGFEADDMLGTIVEQTKKEKNLRAVIVSGDMDTLQLVDDERVVVYTMRKGVEDTVLYNEKKVLERFGFSPKLLPDYKGLRGDASDNIIGVPGIGEKIATETIKHFGSLSNLYRKFAGKNFTPPAFLKPRIAELLRKHKEDALFSKELATIRRDAPVKFSLPQELFMFNTEAVRAIFQTLGFTSLIKRIESGKPAPPLAPVIREMTGLANNGVGFPVALRSVFDDDKALSDFWRDIDNTKTLSLMKTENTFFTKGASHLWYFDEKFFKRERARWAKCISEKDLIFFDGKNVIKSFFAADLPIPERFFDCGVAGWVCESTLKSSSLSELYSYFLDRREESERNVFCHIEELKNAMYALLQKRAVLDVWEQIEKPLMPVLSIMETRGIGIDQSFIATLKRSFADELDGIERNVFHLAGTTLNISSPAQVGEVLFERLGITSKKIKKTTTGKISTRESELIKLKDAHPIVPLILEHREITKLITTYLDPLSLRGSADHKIHTTFNQTGTVTGRLASESPNVQNIPIRSERGARIRNAFVASAGFTLAAFDYVQIELKILASLAEDQKMIEAFQHGVDIHRLTAAEINNVSLDAVTPAMRSAAKAINFGIVFGMGVRQLAASTGMTAADAQQFYREYFDDFPRIRAYIESVRRDVHKNGFTTTMYGRKRFFDIAAIQGNRFLETEMERMAVNAIVQGTDADIVKRAMVRVHKLCDYDIVRPLLQIHDEMIYEIRDDVVAAMIPKIREIMESSGSLRVPVTVGVSIGKRWGEMRKFGDK
ncbi:MAG TPA: DNA polymerase I [Candidatus Paceibacterota bacterium]